MTQTHAQSLVLIQQALDSVGLIGEIHTEFLSFLSQILHILAKLVAIKRELSELLVLVCECLIVILQLHHLVFESGDGTDVIAQHTLQLAHLACASRIHHLSIAFHESKAMIVAAESESKTLRLAIVVEQLFILIRQMINHVFISLRPISKLLEALGSAHSSVHKVFASTLLQHVLLVTEMVFPFVEAVAEVSLSVLLTIGQEFQPVANDLAHLDVLAPPVKHFRLQVVVSPVPMLPPGY